MKILKKLFCSIVGFSLFSNLSSFAVKSEVLFNSDRSEYWILKWGKKQLVGRGYDEDRLDDFLWYNLGNEIFINKLTGKNVDQNGFDRFGIHHITGTRFDTYGRDWDGYDKDDIFYSDMAGTGYGKSGYNHLGFNRKGIHRITQSMYDIDGFDRYRFNKDGINSATRTSFNVKGYNNKGVDCNGYKEYYFGAIAVEE